MAVRREEDGAPVAWLSMTVRDRNDDDPVWFSAVHNAEREPAKKVASRPVINRSVPAYTRSFSPVNFSPFDCTSITSSYRTLPSIITVSGLKSMCFKRIFIISSRRAPESNAIINRSRMRLPFR